MSSVQSAATGTTLRVLIIDDVEDDALLAEATLRVAGYSVIAQRVDTAVALDAALTGQAWDLILCDYRMPHFSGLDALARVRRQDLDLPFILVSGVIGEETAVAALKAGADDYIMKANPARLVPGVQRALREVAERRQRRQIEEALRASESRYRSLVETSPDAIALLDLQGVIRMANQQSAALYHHPSPQALIGRHALELLVPADRERAGSALRALAGGAVLGTRTYTAQRQDGTTFALELQSTRVYSAGVDAEDCIMIIARDVTARNEADERLRFQAHLLETVGQTIVATDVAGVITYWNGAAESLYGWTSAEVVGQNILTILPTVPFRERDADTLASLMGGGSSSGEYLARHRSGRPIPILASAVPLRDADGVVVGLIGVSTDISIRVQAEEARIASEARYRLIVETAHEGIWQLDPHAIIEFVNPAMAAMLGYTVDEMLGTSAATYIDDPDPSMGEDRVRKRRAGSTELFDVRMRHKDGSPRWVLTSGRAIHDAAGGYIGSLAMVTNITARKVAEESLQHQALHDSLTDLPNRALLHARINAAFGDEPDAPRPLALLLFDLDHFKEINDAFGHHRGDALLRKASDRILGVVRTGDTVARLGGDEFAVLLPGADEQRATQVAEAIRVALDVPLTVDGQLLRVAASVGIALAPAHGADGTTLLRRADMAMYAAKRGRLGHALYEPAQDQHNPEHLARIAALREAIELGALLLHYQPQVDLASGRLCGVEALVRWPHPVHGLIPPDQFIPLAEQTGLIAPLTNWVLAEAIRQCKEWQRAGLLLSVSVNLSMWNLHDPALPERIAHLLRDHGLSPARLRLELTESALMTDTVRTADVLARLSALGLGLAVDDFGAGYSSLTYLKKLPVDDLKIDKSFVREMATDPTDAAIVAATVGMGHALGLRVVAEGIEDRATWDLLIGMGCDVAQGYYIARPLTADALVRWVRETSLDRRLDHSARGLHSTHRGSVPAV